MILIQLILAHLINDFIIQGKSWVEDKKEKGLNSVYFWIHIILSGVLAYILLMKWQVWEVPFFIILTHGIIDYWKIRKERSLEADNQAKSKDTDKKNGNRYFFIDQALHLLVILLAWVYLSIDIQVIPDIMTGFLLDKNIMIIITAFVFIIWPAGKIIGILTQSLKNQFTHSDSLEHAGTYIGVAERILVLIFVLMHQYAAIGFLIAGKSILRVSTDKDEEARKKTEYVLIGTLLSFCIAVSTGIIVQLVIQL